MVQMSVYWLIITLITGAIISYSLSCNKQLNLYLKIIDFKSFVNTGLHFIFFSKGLHLFFPLAAKYDREWQTAYSFFMSPKEQRKWMIILMKFYRQIKFNFFFSLKHFFALSLEALFKVFFFLLMVSAYFKDILSSIPEGFN